MKIVETLKKPSTIILIGILIIACAVIGWAIFTLTIPSQGNVSGTTTLSAAPATIDWGSFNQGSITPISRQVTLTNNGGQATAALTMTATTPIGTVTWDSETQTIAAGSSKVVTITLTPSASAPVGAFNFNIVITG